MELTAGNKELESLNIQLNDPEQLEAYKKPYDVRFRKKLRFISLALQSVIQHLISPMACPI